MGIWAVVLSSLMIALRKVKTFSCVYHKIIKH